MISPPSDRPALVFSLPEKIDSLHVSGVEQQIREILKDAPGSALILDAGELRSITSMGLRMLLGLEKQMPGKLFIRNVSPEVYDIFSITGFTSILNVQRKMREIRVENCPVIGRGAVGTVYRLDEETIVKVYEIPDSLSMLEKEQLRAKQALIWGIPTAISFDVVRVGERYGSVFEMIRAENCNDLMLKSPERREEIIRHYVGLLRTMHRITVHRGDLPDARAIYTGYVDQLGGLLPQFTASRLKEMLHAMPEDLHVIHGDIQMKNVMLSGAEPIVIDMETMCAGSPVFEFAGLFVTYCAFSEDEPENTQAFLGLSREESAWVYRQVLSQYLGENADKVLPQMEEKIRVLGYVRFLYLIAVLHLGKPELAQIRVSHTLKLLENLLARVDRLSL